MKKVFGVVLLISFFFGFDQVFAEDELGSLVIFINSDPINADVFIKGESHGKTPLRLVNVDNEKIKLRVEKSDYSSYQDDINIVELPGGKSKHLFLNLSPKNLQVVFYQKNQEVYINNKNVGKTPIEINNLPVGMYQIEREENGISLSNKGSHYLRRTAITETLLASGLFGFSLAGTMYYTEKDNETVYRPLRVSTLIFGGLLGYNLLKLFKINTEIKKNLANMTVIEVERFRADSARHYFSSGMEMIGKEEWNDALLKFNFVVNVFPDSGYTPISIYEIGYCYYQMGDIPKATEYFRRFVFDYPIYELFPYGVFYLLDLELASGDVNQALKDFNVLKPIHLDDASGELHKDYFRILETIYKRTEEPDQSIFLALNDEFTYFLEKNKNSSSYPEIYLLYGKLLYNYLDREEGIRILNDVREMYNYDQDLMKELDSIVNAG